MFRFARQRVDFIGQVKQIVNACVVVESQLPQRLRGDIQRAALIAGIGRLTDVQQLGELYLLEIVILPQIADTFVQTGSPPASVFCLD